MEIFTYEDYLNTIRGVAEEEEEYIINTEKVHKRHDKLIKEILTKEEVSKLLEKYLKLKIEKEKLEEYTNKYITKNYEERESDIVYKIKGRNIYFLIEHQSKVDYKIPFRILEYSIEIMRTALKKQEANKKRGNNKNFKYPQIIPIVIYTGNEKWKVEENISKVQESLEGYREESFKYNLIDINKYTKEELLKENTMFSKIALLEKCKEAEEIIETLEQIIENTKEEKEKLYRIINYIFREK